MEEDRLRPPSPPAIMHYSEHEAALLAEKLKGKQHLILLSLLYFRSRSHPEVRAGEMIPPQWIALLLLLPFPYFSTISMPTVMILTHLLEMHVCPSTCALTAKTQPSEYYKGVFFLFSCYQHLPWKSFHYTTGNILLIKGLILKMSLFFDWYVTPLHACDYPNSWHLNCPHELHFNMPLRCSGKFISNTPHPFFHYLSRVRITYAR